MNILHVTKKYPNALGGDAVVVSNLEKQQLIQGDSVSILTSNCDDIISGAHIYKFGLKDTPESLDSITPKRLISLVVLFFVSFGLFRKIRPDVIHTHSIDMAFFISFAARLYNIPVVHTFHIVTFNNPTQAGLRSKIELFLLRGANPQQIFVLNPADVDDFAKHGFKKVRLVPNGVNLADWQIGHVGTDDQTCAFVSFGRLEDQKGFKYLLDAAAILKSQNVAFSIRIAGEGSKQRELQSQIDNLGLRKFVTLVGKKTPSQLREVMGVSDVFVLSSLWEGMPLSLIEAWAAGLPTIATKVSSVPFIADGASELVDPADEKQLAAAMRLFTNDRSVRQKYAEAGRQRAIANHQWSNIALNLYEGIAK